MTDLSDTRIALLRRELETVRQLLIDHVDTTINELQNALTHVSASRVPLSSRLAQVALTELVESDHEVIVTASLVLAVTAEFHRVSTDELRGPSKAKHLAHARQVAMWLCRQLTGLSLPRIGVVFNRDHTTVMHAVRKIQHQVDTEPVTAQQLADLTSLIKRQSAMNALRVTRNENTRTKGAA